MNKKLLLIPVCLVLLFGICFTITTYTTKDGNKISLGDDMVENSVSLYNDVFDTPILTKTQIFGQDYIHKQVGISQGYFTFLAKNPMNDRTAKIKYDFIEFHNEVEDYKVEVICEDCGTVPNKTLICDEGWDGNQTTYSNCVEDGGVLKTYDTWSIRGNDPQEIVLDPLEEIQVRITAWWKNPTTTHRVLIDVIPEFEYEKDDQTTENIRMDEWTLWDDTDDELIIWLKFDGDLSDSADGANQGGDNTFLASSISYITDSAPVGQMAYFDASFQEFASYTNQAIYQSIFPNHDYSVCGWGNTTVAGRNFWMGSPRGSSNNGFFHADYGDGGGDFYLKINDGGAEAAVSVGDTGYQQLMQFYCFTLEDSTTNGTIYANGASIGSSILGQNQGDPGSNYSLWINMRLDMGGYYDGYYDEITVWNKTLTGEDVYDLYNNNGQPQSNTAPSCTTADTNITVQEDSGAWTLDANMSQAVNISCSDVDGDALTYTCVGTGYTNPNNDDLIFTTPANGTGTYTVSCDVSDGTLSVDVAAQTVVNGVNDGPWWDLIGNATRLESTNQPQPIGVNASSYWRDVEQDQTPTNITISVNETLPDCYMNTGSGAANNFSIFCDFNDFNGTVTITLNGTDASSDSAMENFEIRTNNIPGIPTFISPVDKHLNDTVVLNLSCAGSTDIDEDPVFYDYWNVTSTGTITNSICHNVGSECLWNNTEAPNQWVYWRCNANDTTLSSPQTATRSIRTETWNIIDLNESYYAENGLFIEGEKVFFEINVSHNEIRFTNIISTLNFSNMSYTTVKTSFDNYTNFQATINLPSVAASTTLGWTWINNMTYPNGSVSSNNSYGGSFSVEEIFVLENCTPNSTDVAFFNLSFWDEEMMKEIDFFWLDSENHTEKINIAYNLSVYISDPDINVKLKGDLKNQTAYWACMPIARTYKVLGDFAYYRNDAKSDMRHFYFLGDSYDNVTDEIGLLVLDPWSSTYLQGADELDPLLLSDCDGNPLEGYWVFRKYDHNNDTHKFADMAYQGLDGKATAYLQRKTTIYDIAFRKPDGTYVNMQQYKGPRTVEGVQWNEDCETPSWKSFDEIQTQLSWVGDSFVLQVEMPDNNELFFNVQGIGNTTTVVCPTQIITEADTYKCNFTDRGYVDVPGEYFATVMANKFGGNYTLMINSYTHIIWDSVEQSLRQKVGSEGVIAAYMLGGTMAMAGAAISPIVGLALFGISLIGLSFMKVLYLPFTTILVMCFILGWGIYKLRR